MAGNSYGQMFRVTTFGESHGKALGAIIAAVHLGLNCRKLICNPILIVVNRASQSTQPSGAKATKCKFLAAYLRG